MYIQVLVSHFVSKCLGPPLSNHFSKSLLWKFTNFYLPTVMDIFTMLQLRHTASPDEVKRAYYRRLATLHPTYTSTDNSGEFISLQSAYACYLLGEDCTDCYAVCTSNRTQFECRCKGIYMIQGGYLGRIDCEYCSCFIFVEDLPKQLGYSTE